MQQGDAELWSNMFYDAINEINSMPPWLGGIFGA